MLMTTPFPPLMQGTDAHTYLHHEQGIEYYTTKQTCKQSRFTTFYRDDHYQSIT